MTSYTREVRIIIPNVHLTIQEKTIENATELIFITLTCFTPMRSEYTAHVKKVFKTFGKLNIARNLKIISSNIATF